jgi:Flp pilus assembly pilin Flp
MRRLGTHPRTWRRRLMGDESGATMVEYSLMLVLVLVVALAAVQAFGLSVFGLFQSLVDAL